MPGDLLNTEWQAEFTGWKAIQSIRRARIAGTKLRVIILGPGKDSFGHDKRLIIRQHLQQDANNDVAFLEELVKDAKGQTPNNIILEQAYYIEEANVVIALAVATEKVTGVLNELVTYRNMLPTFEAKTWLILPRGGGKDKSKARSKGLIQSEVAQFPNDHKLFYNHDEFAECTKIRAYAQKQVDNARNRIFYDAVIQKARAK